MVINYLIRWNWILCTKDSASYEQDFLGSSWTNFHIICQQTLSGGWGYSHVKAYGYVPPRWVTFSQKILRHGSHFGVKILRRGSHFTKIAGKKKMVKSTVFEVEKPLVMGSDLRKFQGGKNVKSAVFWGRKILRFWVGVSDLGLHTLSKNNLSTPSPGTMSLSWP